MNNIKKLKSYTQVSEILKAAQTYYRVMEQWATSPDEDLTDEYRKPLLMKVTELMLVFLELTHTKYDEVFKILDEGLCYVDPLRVLAELRKMSTIADLRWQLEFERNPIR